MFALRGFFNRITKNGAHCTIVSLIALIYVKALRSEQLNKWGNAQVLTFVAN